MKVNFYKSIQIGCVAMACFLLQACGEQPTTKIYFETYLPSRNGSPSNVFQPENNTWDVEFVNSPEAADMIVLWLIPEGKSLFQSDGSPLHVNLSNIGIDVKDVNSMLRKPTILAINYTNPWVIDDVYTAASKNIKAVMATFGTTPEAILDIVMGKFQPSGKMPFPHQSLMKQRKISSLMYPAIWKVRTMPFSNLMKGLIVLTNRKFF